MSNEHVPTFKNLLSRDEIIRRITEKWEFSTETETIPVTDALNRVPSGDVFSVVTLPVVRASGGGRRRRGVRAFFTGDARHVLVGAGKRLRPRRYGGRFRRRL